MTLIGLVGRARSGKDTVANLMGLPILKLAKPVKDAVRVLYGWTDMHIEGALKDTLDPKFNITPREAMIHITNAMKKRHGIDFFANRFMDEWDGKSGIVTDVRYQVDAEILRLKGAVIVRVERPGCSFHPHEDGLENIRVDYLIRNDGTVSDLIHRIHEFLNR
jgi:hypothetical protein